VTHDATHGTLRYRVESGGATLIENGAMGIATDRGDLSSGLVFESRSSRAVDESYTLPVGKRSHYVNRAGELELGFRKGSQELRLVLRAYDDGIAFRYALPGSGEVQIPAESTSFPLAGSPIRYWGQPHPNDYGYESPLGPVTAARISMPVLAELEPSGHFVFLAQAASYQSYVIPHYERSGDVLSLRFPLDQREPVKTALPFESPWRVAIVSRGSPGAIVESVMLENLNPPTEEELVDAAWIRPGRASWDYIAGGGADLGTWVDFGAEMGWEYHVADAGWERRVPGIAGLAAYARSRGVGIIAWGKIANRTALNTPRRAEDWMAMVKALGISGVKIDFFDQRDGTGEKTDDLEDTQQRLFVRDFLSEIAARHQLLVEYHGSAVPSGERRRWPHVMSAEAIYGMERRTQNLEHDLTVPYVRNVMGPASFTPLHLERSAGSHAYQLGQVVLYEAGIQIFAERHDAIRSFAGVEFLKAVPAAWDETRFVDGYPSSHAILARRSGEQWFVGGITGEARVARVPLGFLAEGVAYRAVLHRDGDAKTSLVIEEKTVTRGDELSLELLPAGGFAARLAPVEAAPGAPGE
jgi:alpha-glucosidase